MQCLGCGGLRLGVGHVEDGGDSTAGGGTALAFHRCLVGEPGLAEVYVGVDDAGQDVGSLGIYNSIEGIGSVLASDSFCNYLFYAVTVDDDVGLLFLSVIDYGSAFD